MKNRAGQFIERIISGGQTGVDRAALDVALRLGIPHGGFCPRDRRAEDGPIAPHYQLEETAERDYAVWTRRNVEWADGTLILHLGSITGDTLLTRQIARALNKPIYEVNLRQSLLSRMLWQWVEDAQIRVLNVAGPRESTAKGIYDLAARFLETWLTHEAG